MTTEDKNIADMFESASSSIDEELNINSNQDDVLFTYEPSQNLLSKGYKYNNDGLYCSLNTTDDFNFYLKISREETSYSFTIGTYVNDVFEAKSIAFTSNKSICQEHGDRNKKLGQYANTINNSYPKGAKPFEKGLLASRLTEIAIDLLNEPNFSQINKEFKVYKNEMKEVESSIELNDDELDNTPKEFEEYEDFVRYESKSLVEDDTLFEKIRESISLTHEGNSQLKKKLPLILASPIVDEPIQTELDADTGKGKTDVIIETIKNYPSRYIHVLRTISPKNIYYDRDSYNEDFNILVFDDVVLKSDMIEVIKELSDNNKPIKELRTVIDGKAVKFTLKGKFLVILTYAKSNPDEELLNRLYKLDIIINNKNDESNIKEKIKNNAIITSDNNQIIARNRLFMQGAIQYLIEKDMMIFNPFNSLFNPKDMNNRDIKAFVSMVKSKTFYHYHHRKQLQVNEFDITIGSFDDFDFVNELWIDDGDVQRYKLNPRQKQILEYLPSMTREDAYTNLEEFKDNLPQSKGARDKEMEKLHTYKNIAKHFGINVDTLRNDMYKKSEGTSKTLYDLGLIDFIKYNEDNPKSQNVFFKVEDETQGDVSKSSESNRYNRQIEFTDLINSLNYKIKIIKDLLLSVNIIVNEKGYIYISSYCKNYQDKLDVEDYDSYYNFIANFVKDFNFEEFTIPIVEASQRDIERFMSKSKEIDDAISEKKENIPTTSDNGKFTDTEKPKEKPQNRKVMRKPKGKSKIPKEPIGKSKNKNFFDEKGIDVEIAKEVSEFLSDEHTLAEIQSKLCEHLNPYEDNDTILPIKVERNVKLLAENNLIREIEYMNQAKRYKVTHTLVDKLNEVGDDV